MATDQADFERERLDRVLFNLAKEDGLIDEAGNWIQAPHCDALVLHAPGTCSFCDRYPDRQNARIARRVAFTGEEHHPTKTRCPSEYFRPADLIHRWGGNRPTVAPDLSNFKVITDEPEPQTQTNGVKLEPDQVFTVSYEPGVHDFEVLSAPEIPTAVVFRPKAVKDDNYPKEVLTITVNGVDHVLQETRVSYHTIVMLAKEDRGEHEYRDCMLFTVKYKWLGPDNYQLTGTLYPGQAIDAKQGMEFQAAVTGDA